MTVKKLLFIADDLGANKSINDAIFHAHLHGALHGAALMSGQPATDAAVARARDVPDLVIGWHVHLTDSQPCTLASWPWRNSLLGAGFALGFSARHRRLIREEIRAQWSLFEQTGLPCGFVSGHHHLHIHPFVRQVIVDTLPNYFSGWIRWGTPRFFRRRSVPAFHTVLHHFLQSKKAWPCRTSTTLWGLDRTAAMRADEIAAVLPSLGNGLHEFMFHPRRILDDADTRCLIELRRILSAPDDS